MCIHTLGVKREKGQRQTETERETFKHRAQKFALNSVGHRSRSLKFLHGVLIKPTFAFKKFIVVIIGLII